jgi:hypothetical protein
VWAEKPSPPNAVTTTLDVAGPRGAISPAVEQPISGVPGASSPIPASSDAVS